MNEPATSWPWWDKVRLVKGDRSLAQIERAAGWNANQLAAAMSAKVDPSSTKGVKLAEALGVTAHWLFDESRSPAEMLTDSPGNGVSAAVLMRDFGSLLNAAIAAFADQVETGRPADDDFADRVARYRHILRVGQRAELHGRPDQGDEKG